MSPSPADQDISEELAAQQRQISISEFFEKNRQMLGFDSEAKALVTAVKEAVDNALDATEEARILPEITVEIQDTGDYYTLIIEDNGPGITKEQIPKIFGKLLYGSRFGSRQQSRGQQGIGISAAVLYSQLTSGKPARITSKANNSDIANYYELIIDTDNNEPEIKTEKETSWDKPHGTRIELEMEGNMRARSQLHKYIKYTAVVNPHATVHFTEPREELHYERTTDELPDETHEIKPHPHGVELGTLIKMFGTTNSQTLSGFLQNEFTRVGKTTANKIIAHFRDNHYGREFTLTPPPGPGTPYNTADTEETTNDRVLNDIIENAISRKDPDASSGLATTLAEKITNTERVSYTTLETLTNTAADESEDEYDERFGDTVRENIITAAWSFLETTLEANIHTLVDNATSQKKTNTVITNFSERLTAHITQHTDTRLRLTRTKLEDLIETTASTTEQVDHTSFGDTARKNITEEIWAAMETTTDKPPLVREFDNNRDMCSELLEAMQLADIMAPPTDCLSPIGAENIEKGLQTVFDADFYSASTRDADVHGGDPFIAEAGIAYGGELDDDGQAELLRFANRVPLVYQRGGCATTTVIRKMGWRNYGLSQPGGSGLPNGPIVILVHVASTSVPFTSESKDALASIPEIENEVELAVREAARELKSYLNEQKSLRKHQKKQNTITEILPEMSEKIGSMTNTEEPPHTHSLARIMNNVYINKTTTGDTTTITVHNYQNSKETVEITETITGGSVTLPDDSPGMIIEEDDTTTITWDVSLPSGETETLEYTHADTTDANTLSINEIEDAKVNVEGGDAA